MSLFACAGSVPYRGILLSIILALANASAAGDELWTRLFEENLAKAQSGDPDAQYEVGIMFLKGQGVEADRAQAVKWLTSASAAGNEAAAAKLRRMDDREGKFQELLKAAENGDSGAQYDIAMMYLKGQGIEQDKTQARLWLNRAAKQGDAKAITRLGILNYKGELGKRDYSEAQRLFEQVQDESVLAQYYLGEMYAAGEGVEMNYATAIDWYRRAADGGFRRASGKIINLEEELKMQQRRDARREAPGPAASAAPPAAASAEPVPVSPPPQPEKPKQPAKPAERAKPLSALQKLAGKQWMKKDEPIEFLPSRVSDCEMEEDQLVCFSEILQRTSGDKVVQYRVKSVIRSPDNKSYDIAYRNLVLDVTVQETEDDDQPPGYDAATDQGFHIQTGWTREHSVACGVLSDRGLECIKDGAHQINLVEG
ncbi:MAG: sel1 repeat family protein [Thiogranum sp.]|nr:sel1 repeat family protein [Thiogranum sp.]